MSEKVDKKQRRSAEQVDAFVLDAVAASSAPTSAYALVRRSAEAGAPLVPVQVYRSLERLLKLKKIERITTSNAFVAARVSQPIHLLCVDCEAHEAAEAWSAHEFLSRLCREKAFVAHERYLEVVGHCRKCELDSQ